MPFKDFALSQAYGTDEEHNEPQSCQCSTLPDNKMLVIDILLSIHIHTNTHPHYIHNTANKMKVILIV